MKILDRLALRLWSFVNRALGPIIDRHFEHEDVTRPTQSAHLKWINYLHDNFDKEGCEILEIGSREVTGTAEFPSKLKYANYTGFDIYDGNNVNIVGDAHDLSSYIEEGKNYDLIFSSACFEHFVQPWKVATEFIHSLKLGGHVFVETHFAFSSHERPWHFFHFTDLGLKSLFPEKAGIICIESGMSNPIVARFSSEASSYLQQKKITGMYCHTAFLGKKVKEIGRDKLSTSAKEITKGARYPT